jgi:NADH-quinone oxidoreductase subunit L
MLNFIWIIPLLPLVGFLVNVFAIKRERDAGYVASGVVGAAFLFALLAFLQLGALPAEERMVDVVLWNWISVGDFRVPFGLLFDPLTAVMTLLVTGVGGLIHVYSIGYMHGDVRPVRFFAYLNLFIFMMLILVMADNMLLLFLGWEGVGLCSFLLIGHWFDRNRVPPGLVPSKAAVKAFVVNRVGDAAILLAMVAIFFSFGSLNFFNVELGETMVQGFIENAGLIGSATVTIPGDTFLLTTTISFLLLIGVTGKSAQIPLFVWLPDAMAGPTPVSALIHAATMVTAGVYLIARTHPIFSGFTLGLVTWVGALTALIAGTAAIAQWDIKRVLAYSTVSQLGFMVAAAGMGAYAVAIFHLLTHGIFKALLFLGSGSVIHGAHENQDMRKMGGLRKDMPVTFWTFLIGAAALAGVFPLAGFWSKDEILATAWSNNIIIFFILLTTSLATAFYMGRQVALVFFGEQRDKSYHAHESGSFMTIPLMVLMVGALVGGVMNLPGTHWLGHWLEPVLAEETVKLNIVLAVVTGILAVLAALSGWWYYVANAAKVKLGGQDPLYHYLGAFWEGFQEAWYFDDFYNNTVVRGYRGLSSFLARIFDPEGIDGIVNGVGWVLSRAATGVRSLQTGYVRTYAFIFLVGVILIIGYLVVAL